MPICAFESVREANLYNKKFIYMVLGNVQILFIRNLDLLYKLDIVKTFSHTASKTLYLAILCTK